MSTNLNTPADEWLNEMFEHEFCAECGGDQPHHDAIPVMGNWFARCKQPLAAGLPVLSQDGNNHRGVVIDERHPLEGWVWVQWEHIGRHDEAIEDLTVDYDRRDAS